MQNATFLQRKQQGKFEYEHLTVNAAALGVRIDKYFSKIKEWLTFERK